MLRALLFTIVLLLGAVAVAEARGTCSAAAGGPCPEYDRDGDGVRNDGPGGGPDNCPDRKNADQENVDGDALGDACDDDTDGDGVPDAQPDNCRFVPNPDQADADGNGYGDECPPVDSDDDGVTDDRDNCVRHPNPDQADSEPSQPDGKGDVCDGDDDDDRYADHMDNCPFVDNPEQTDRDGDGIGTACDGDELGPPPPPGPDPAARGPESPAAETDRSAPALRVSASRTWTSGYLRGGAPLLVRCSEACGVTARITLRGRLLADGVATLGGAGRTYVFFDPRRGAIRRVARLRSRTRAVLTIRAFDEAGNRRTATRRVWLRR